MSYARMFLPALAAMALIGADKPQPRTIQPRWEFHVRANNKEPDHLCFSEDGSGIVWFTDGDKGLVQYQRWRLPSGQSIPSKPFPVEPRPEFDGTGDTILVALNTARHEHSRALTWSSLAAPLMDWGSGRELDFDAGTRTSIPGHPGRDEPGSFGVEPGWIIENLHVQHLGPIADVGFSCVPEWAGIPASRMKTVAAILFRSKWNANSAESIAPDGSWVAAASDIEPNLPVPEQGQWPFHDERTLRIWRAGTVLPIHRIPLTSKIRSLSFSPHGHYLIAEYEGGNRELWDTEGGDLIGRLPEWVRFKWRNDESRILFMDSANQLHTLQTPSLEERASFKLQGLISLTLDPDLRLAASCEWMPIEGKDGPHEVRILVYDLSEAYETHSSPSLLAGQTGQGH